MNKSELAMSLGVSVEQLDGLLLALARDKRLRGTFDSAINVSFATNRLVGFDLDDSPPEGHRADGSAIWRDEPTWVFPDQA